MAIDQCADVCECVPQKAFNKDTFRYGIYQTLCNILTAVTTGESTRYDLEFLCDPTTGDPVWVRYSYDTDGTVNGVTAFNVDGTAYAGAIGDLVACEESATELRDPLTLRKMSVIPVSGATQLNGLANLGIVLEHMTTDTAEAASTTTVINATAHVARIGDIVEMTTGTAANVGMWSPVINTTANSITVSNAFASAVAAGDQFLVKRPRTPTYPSSSNIAYFSYPVNIDINAQGNTARGLLKQADAAHVSGDAGVQTLGVVQAAGTMVNFSTTQSDYAPFAVNPTGSQFVDINTEAIGSAFRSKSILKLEDSASASGDAGVAILLKRLDTPVTQAADGDYTLPTTNNLSAQYVDIVRRGTPTETTPTINNATSTTIAAANTGRRKIEIQNNSAANIMISMTGATLTGIVPSATNIGKVIAPGATYSSPEGCASVSAITAYQTSGGAINTVTVTEYS